MVRKKSEPVAPAPEDKAPAVKKAAAKKPAAKAPAKKAPAKKNPPKKPAARKKPGKEKAAPVQPAAVAQSPEQEGIDPTQVLADQLGLTARQKRFADEYLLDLNGTQAAIRSGYSEKCAAEIASENLRKPHIKEYIDTRKAQISAATGITPELVLKQWYGMATADANALVEFRRTCCRYCYGEGFQYQRTASEMQRDRLQYQIEVAKAQAADPKAEVPEFNELGGIGYNRTKDPHPDCPECFGEGVGDAFFKDTRNLPPEVLALYAGVKIGKDGIEVKMHSKDNALTQLARHLNMFEEKPLEVNMNMTSREDLDRAYAEALAIAMAGREVVRKRQEGKGE